MEVIKKIKTTLILSLVITTFNCSKDDDKPATVATNIELVSGDNQTATVGTALTNPVEVIVKDQNGNSFKGSTVNFTVAEGSLSSATGVTDTTGKATVIWTLGASVGTQTLTVTAFKANGTTPLTGSPLSVTATASTESVNQAPEAFNLIEVENNATNVDVSPTFSWGTATDPDGDTVTYDLYIDGNENPTTLFAENITATNYQVQGRLFLVEQYYWKVVAKDNNGNTTQSNATFSFTTRNLSFQNTPITANAPFSARWGHTTVVFDDKLWVIGGFRSQGVFENDVWHSTDGSTWIQATTNADFSARWGHTTVIFDNKLWVIGGIDLSGFRNDIWNSSDGINWTQVIEDAAFSKRRYHTTTVFDNKLWLIGGGDVGGNINDVWYSTDGSTWTQAIANADFSERDGHTATVFDNKLWVIGGREAEGGSNYKNDAWYSTDGSTWTQATANATFSERGFHTTAVFDSKLWVIAGWEGSSNYKNDVWYSEDGSIWEQTTTTAFFSERYLHTTAVFDNKLWVIGGFAGSNFNDVWVMD